MRPFRAKEKEFARLAKVKTPQAAQDFLDRLPMNFEKSGPTCYSPLLALRRNRAHCLEGALLGAAMLWQQGQPPLLLDLETTNEDDSHVVAVFKQGGLWGALSKTNHAVLRYRDPIFKNIRELALSYFNEYFKASGKKTLRRHSTKPFNLLELPDSWLTSPKPLWHIERALARAPHQSIVSGPALARLRPADRIEVVASGPREWERSGKRNFK